MADTSIMTGTTVLVTGGTGGIGKATAIGLARLGARVGVTGRDAARAEAAAAEIRTAAASRAVDAFAADQSSQTEVRRLATEVLDAYPRPDVLVSHDPPVAGQRRPRRTHRGQKLTQGGNQRVAEAITRRRSKPANARYGLTRL